MKITTRIIPILVSLPMFACDEPNVVDGEPAPDASAEQDDPDDYALYKKYHATQGADGRWIVEGDIILADEAEVRAYFDQTVRAGGPGEPQCEEGQVCLRSTVRQSSTNARDYVWNVHEKLALAYCIGDLGSTTDYNRVRTALDAATRAWESAADVNFIHLSALDGSGITGCIPGQNNVVFKVVRDGNCESETLLARAFFPDWDDLDRYIHYCDHGLEQNDAKLLEITKHELGHVLGLVHEHYRYDQDEEKCIKGSSGKWRALTAPDAASIMGYEFCDGTIGNDDLSPRDRTGIHRLYNISKGHGRLFGGAFDQANSFLGQGVSDDIFWYRPGLTQFQLWSTNPLPGNTGTPIAFTKDSFTAATGVYYRPMPLQWYPQSINFDRDVLFYGPGSVLGDQWFKNLGNGDFAESSLVINGYSLPLLGDFHSQSFNRTEIVWWGDGDPYLWQADGAGGISQTVAMTTIQGVERRLTDYFAEGLLAGNFGLGAGFGAEILHHGACLGVVSRGIGTQDFESVVYDLPSLMFGSCSTAEYIPLLGDFTGDNMGDIFWYGPGAVRDKLWRLEGTLWDTVAQQDVRGLEKTVNGIYKPIVGDFNGDNLSDIFWYQPGTGSDPIWLFHGDGAHTSLTNNVNGDYSPVAGDFNNDSCTDIVWFDAPNDRIQIWRSNCDGSFTAQIAQNVPSGAYPVGYGLADGT